MSTTPTANYAWLKPTPGTETDTWGTILNNNYDSQDTVVKAVSDKANAAMPMAGATAVGGTVDAITATFSPAFTAYAVTMRFRFTATGANTITNPTISVDGLGAKVFKKLNGAALAAADIAGAGHVCDCTYDGVNVVLLNPATANITDGSVTTAKIADANITTAKIADDNVTNAKLANMAAGTYKMRVTASTGDPEDATATQATAGLNAMVGDSGAGGTKGLVPAPAAGDAAAGKVLSADGTWKGGVARGWIDGLQMSTDAVNTVTVTAGQATADDGSYVMNLSSSLAKLLSSAWAVGTGNGGLDTGAEAANTWYHVWLIARSDTGVVDALLSTSATAPTMPTNYDKKRRIGSIRNNASSNILDFIQRGDVFLWKDAILEFEDTNPGTAAVLRTMTVPLGIRVLHHGSFFGHDLNMHSITCPDVNNQALDAAGASNFTSGNYQTYGVQINVNGQWMGVPVYTHTNTSSQIRTRVQTSSASVEIAGFTRGWTDPRGRDA